MKKKFTKSQTTYYDKHSDWHIFVNEEVKDHISLTDTFEACGGFLTHWGDKAKLIAELKEAIKILEDFNE